MQQLINSLKTLNYQIPKELIFNYKKINITELELIFIIYLINQDIFVYNPKKMCSDLNVKLEDVLENINSLMEKGIIKIEITKVNNIREEYLNLDGLYEKLSFILMEEKNDKPSKNLYDIFEVEFGRTLSPMEYEIINCWKETGYSEELIILALKEATYNGVSNLRYIDKIIYEWGRKGIKNKEDVEKNRKSFKRSNNKNNELFDYDWLNDESNS